MKKYYLLYLLIISCSKLFAQNVNQAVERDFINYSKLISDKKTDQALNYINPKLFDLVPKEQMKVALEAVFNLPNIEYKIAVPTITKFSEVKTIDKISYVKLETISPVEMKFYDVALDSNKLNMMLKSFQNKFGTGNVKYDQKSGFFKINAIKQAVASSADQSNWKFVTIDNASMLTLLEKIIPAELLK